MRIGILGSGSGTNLQAIIDAIDRSELDARIVLVLSDHQHAGILRRASDHGIPTRFIDCGSHRSKFPESAQLATVAMLREAGAELVCLAGFMRLLRAPMIRAFPNAILNIHPSLLPAFPGLEAWNQALAAGVSETGCTIHLVDEGMDSGEILLQRKVPVLPDDDAQSLHRRIQVAEHELYPQAIRQWQSSHRRRR